MCGRMFSGVIVTVAPTAAVQALKSTTSSHLHLGRRIRWTLPIFNAYAEDATLPETRTEESTSAEDRRLRLGGHW